MTLVMLMFAVTPFVFGQASGSTGVSITPEDIVPRIWSCADRLIVDDNVNPGRSTTAGDLSDRVNNYAFEGEQIEWTVLVMNENGVGEIDSVEGTVTATQGINGIPEVGCLEVVGVPASLGGGPNIPASCNAQIDGNSLTGTALDTTTQRFYTCTLTVETAADHTMENYMTVEVTSGTDSAIVVENEFWYLNPVVGLTITGGSDGGGLLTFTGVRPGAVAYSDTVIVENSAATGSGVLLDMFVSGTDFTDPASSGALCPTSNVLKLGNNFAENEAGTEATGEIADLDDVCSIDHSSAGTGDHFCYYASSGSYSTENDIRADAEGYVPIVYGSSFDPTFYNDAEIIGGDSTIPSTLTSYGSVNYYSGNVLSPGAEIAMTFKLGLPSPCVGDFSEGDIYFWGEVI